MLQTNYDCVVDCFDDMELKEKLLRGIYAYGFEKPSAIQQRAIKPCIEGMLYIRSQVFTVWKHIARKVHFYCLIVQFFVFESVSFISPKHAKPDHISLSVTLDRILR